MKTGNATQSLVCPFCNDILELHVPGPCLDRWVAQSVMEYIPADVDFQPALVSSLGEIVRLSDKPWPYSYSTNPEFNQWVVAQLAEMKRDRGDKTDAIALRFTGNQWIAAVPGTEIEGKASMSHLLAICRAAILYADFVARETKPQPAEWTPEIGSPDRVVTLTYPVTILATLGAGDEAVDENFDDLVIIEEIVCMSDNPTPATRVSWETPPSPKVLAALGLDAQELLKRLYQQVQQEESGQEEDEVLD